MARLDRCREYLTVGATLDDLRRQEPEMRAAGFRKRRNGHGQAKTVTSEYFQWWDRKDLTSRKARRESLRCIRCGARATKSRRGQSQWCKVHLLEYREYAKNYYHEKLKSLRRKEVTKMRQAGKDMGQALKTWSNENAPRMT